ncbi:HET-domain-containing protein [Bimuria novae-zelandiae CBS 107.79]|uniref:HET-domain-containing protein n=1 Tax=Bimuria novae-zelandiae CBS 107.79 TaxID=1447943 RepID=A0A6A5VS32_9PLEO|nr:HET-domain-containing protein [Bimuria novae-zelandiae CBS 107.79]
MASNGTHLPHLHSESIGHNECCEQQARKNQQDPANQKPYKYKEIARKRGGIRILKLHPGNPQNPDVECELIETGTDGTEPVKYEALSWCWGKEKMDNYINLHKGDKVFTKHIQPNLFKALKALRYRNKYRHLWVDAVCINQDNIEEKNHQVEMMFEIYGNADNVCIWLGDSNESSCLALRFIEQEVLKLKDFDRLCEQRDASAKWRALLELMQRDWFSRRWVVQEIALAREATVYCGQHSIGWKDFAVAVELFVEVETATHRLSEVMRKNTRDEHVPDLFEHVSALGASLLVDATDRLFRDFKQEHQVNEENNNEDDDEDEADDEVKDGADKDASIGESPNEMSGSTVVAKNKMRPLLSLEYLVSSLTIFDTTMPHDTIYALLAIAKDTTPQAASRQSDVSKSTDYVRQGLEVFTQRKRYTVDYDLPYVDVCKEFVQFAIARSTQVDPSRALDVICRPWATDQKVLNKRKYTEEQDQKRLDLEIRRRKRALDKRLQMQLPLATDLRSRERAEQLAAERQKQTKRLKEELDDLENKFKRHEKKKQEDMDLPSWVPQLSGAPFGMYQQAGIEGVKMSRKNADPLVGLPSTTHKIYAAAENKRVDSKILKFRKRCDLDLNHYSMYARGFELDIIDKVEQVSLNGQIPREWADLAGWNDAKGKLPEAFWRTLVADRGKDGKNPPVYYSKACAESFKKGGYESGAVNTKDLIHYEQNSVVSQFCRRVQAVIWNRALIRTKKSRLGLVSKDVKEGDLVCILYGLSVPVILNKSDRKDEDVYEKELQWEAEFLVNMVHRSWVEHKERRRQHELRKSAEMAELLRQWRKKSKWVTSRDLVKRVSNALETGNSKLTRDFARETIEEAIKTPLKDFDEFRRTNWKEEWPSIEKRLEREKLAKLAKKQGKGTVLKENEQQSAPNEPQPSGVQVQIGAAVGKTPKPSLARAEEYGFVYETTKDGTTDRKRLVDWWEFDYQLKAFRRWKEIVKERKKCREEEWKDIVDRVEELRKKNEFSRYKGKRQQENLWKHSEEDEKTFAEEKKKYEEECKEKERKRDAESKDESARYSKPYVTRELLKLMLAQIESGNLERPDHHNDSGPIPNHESPMVQSASEDEGERALDGSSTGSVDPHLEDENTTAGAQEANIDDVPMSDSTATLLPARASTTAEPSSNHTLDKSNDSAEPNHSDDYLGKVRPSWIKKAQREALQRAKEKAKARDHAYAIRPAPPEESPKKKELTKEDEENRDAAMKDIKDALRERYGDDGYYSYKMLGECYIHGMMDGEAMLLQNEGDVEDPKPIPAKVFEIR